MKKTNLFKLFSLFFLFVLTSGLKSPTAEPIEDPAPNEIYYVVQYMKVHPTKDNDYVRLETEVWKKLHEARKEAGVLDSWYLYRVLSPSGTGTEYNFVTINVYNSKEKLAGHYESYGVNYSDFLDSDEIAIALQTDDIRDLVNEEVWQLQDRVLAQNPDKMYKYQVVNAMRLEPGKTGDEYAGLERKSWKPVHAERVKAGKMHGWLLYNLVLPGGTDVSYTWGTTDLYDTFQDILESSDPFVAKVHSQKEVEKIMEETLATRDLIRSEVRMLIDYVQ